MTIMTAKDASEGTCRGKLSNRLISEDEDDDETFLYVEITERLMTSRANFFTEKNDDKNSRLPMRKSLFANVPPYVLFHGYKKIAMRLPREIGRHLLWWHTRKYSPRMIRWTVLKSGFTMTTDPQEDWCGTWCSKSAYSRIGTVKNFQKSNHFPNGTQLSNKISLCRNLARMAAGEFGRDFDFMPASYVLPTDGDKLRRFIKKYGGIWIIKPPACCAGRGIRLVSRCKEIPKNSSYVAQRYLLKPRLIDGFKFDIRIYVLLTSVDPLRIYIYSEGLVRFATVRYINNINNLWNRFMHLTNTTVNKQHPKFTPNDNPKKSKGNIWSLSSLFNYIRRKSQIDTTDLWYKIKDIAIKTIISAEELLVQGSDSTRSKYNSYQLFGFDILLDENFKPWLLEVNDCPSMDPDTPLCDIIKSELTKDYLNLVGFHIPNLLTEQELSVLRRVYGEDVVCYDHQLYAGTLTRVEREKQDTYSKISRFECLETILESLTPDDVRVLIRHEDEIARTGQFERIFPTCSTYEYFKYFVVMRYYNVLLDAWEKAQGNNRSKGIARLRRFCRMSYHLTTDDTIRG